MAVIFVTMAVQGAAVFLNNFHALAIDAVMVVETVKND